MSYTAWSVVFGEQPTAAKWNQLGSNDAGFKDGTNIDDDAIIQRHLAAQAVGAAERKEVVKAGRFTETANGNLAVTGVGFTPKALLVFPCDTDHVSASVANMSIGISDGSSASSIGFRAQEGGDISGTISQSLLCYVPSTGAGQGTTLTLVSFDADGFTVSVANHGTTTTFAYLAFA